MMILAVFRSRTHSLAYAERLQRQGIAAVAIPTPREANIGCGICVRFDGRYFQRAYRLIKTGAYPSFWGFYRLEFFNGKPSVHPYRY